MSKETVNAYRVTFLVDADTFQFLARSHGFNESGELWLWESTEETTVEREFCNECERALDAGEGHVGYCQWCYETQGLCEGDAAATVAALMGDDVREWQV